MYVVGYIKLKHPRHLEISSTGDSRDITSTFITRNPFVISKMDFAPYQSSPPEHSRVASPDFNTSSPRHSHDAASRRPFSPNNARSPPPLQHPQPQRTWAGLDGQTSGWPGATVAGRNVTDTYPVAEVSEFDTSLGLRLDYEACLAYVALPPLGAIILLIFERNSDYVR
jgi:hypothetical protein